MRYFGLLITSLILAACASTSSVESQSDVSESISVTSLPPQTLNPGKCGLFLWSAGEVQNFIGFESETGVKLILDETRLSVSRQEAGALDATVRTYESTTGQTIDLTLRKDKEIPEGQRFTGRLSSKTEEGWDRVLPVVAILSCLPDSTSAQ